MATIKQFNDILKAFDFKQVIGETMFEKREDIYDLNRAELTLGYRVTGERIGVYASPAYERMKRQMNPSAGGWVDLKLTGSFQGEITLRMIGKANAIVYSQDSKFAKIIGQYGSDILGLPNKRVSELIENRGFKSTLQKKTKEGLRL